MELLAVTDLGSSNEISFVLGLFISILFFIQYRKYEQQMEKDEMIERFLKN